MPSNDPFIKDFVAQYIEVINAQRIATTTRPLYQALEEVKKASAEHLNGTIKGGPGDGQPLGNMQAGAEEHNFLAVETQLVGLQHNGPMKALDIGTFTGASALAIAAAMPHGGMVITCDREAYRDNKGNDIAEKSWVDAGVRDRITPLKGDALEIMDALISAEPKSFDLVFIDADKASYPAYYEKAKQLLRPGGVVMVDNALWSGWVADKRRTKDVGTNAIRGLNARMMADADLAAAGIIAVGDGIAVGVMKPDSQMQEVAQVTGATRGTAL